MLYQIPPCSQGVSWFKSVFTTLPLILAEANSRNLTRECRPIPSEPFEYPIVEIVKRGKHGYDAKGEVECMADRESLSI
jgi:hypothetical protein